MNHRFLVSVSGLIVLIAACCCATHAGSRPGDIGRREDNGTPAKP